MNVLVFAPHNDDEILGVGGTIKKHIIAGDDVYVVEATSGVHYKELQENARKAHEYLGVKKTFFLNLPVCQLANMNQMEINAAISEVVKEVQPEVAYIPFTGDMHSDHRVFAECAMVALRPIGDYSIRSIYMYETLSETGWNIPTPDKAFIPNAWVDITETIDNKLKAMSFYESQIREFPHPRSKESIIALARSRGTTIGVECAESFMLIRHIVK